jgi:hypothetical protein
MSSIEGIFIALFLALVVCSVFKWRNNRVLNARIRASAAWTGRANTVAPDKWRILHAIYESYPSYDSMIWNLKCWSYNQWFRGYEARLDAAVKEIMSDG